MLQITLSSFQTAMGLLAEAFFVVSGVVAVVFALRHNPRPEERDTQDTIHIRDSFRRLLALCLVFGAAALLFSVLSTWFEYQDALWLSAVLASVVVSILLIFFALLWHTYRFVIQVTKLSLRKNIKGKVGTG